MGRWRDCRYCCAQVGADLASGQDVSRPVVTVEIQDVRTQVRELGAASLLPFVAARRVKMSAPTASRGLRSTTSPRLVLGSKIGAFATSEPGASSDLSPAAIQTAATRTGAEWVLNGRKRWITNSVAAGVILVLARSGDEELTTFIVPTERAGVKIGVPDLKLGNRAQITADVEFCSVELEDELVLGGQGRSLLAACT